MMLDMDVAARVMIGKLAAELYEYANGDDLSDEEKRCLLDRLRFICGLDEPTPPANKAMSNDEAREWEKTEIPFGKYRETPIKFLALDYLVWLADEGGKFQRELNRYLKSPRLKRAIEDAD